MATFVGTVSSPLIGATPLGQTVTISDADMQSLLAYLVAKYTPRRPGADTTPPTPQQALTLWFTEFVGRTVAELQASQLQQAQAAVAVAPITATITPNQ